MKHEIFPTPVWHIKGAPQQLIDELLHGAEICKNSVETSARSNEGGYQSPPFDWDQFHPEGKKYIEDIVRGEIKKDIEVRSWWYNINPTGAWNTPHSHPGSDLAAVLYLTDTNGEFVFLPNTSRTIDDNRGYKSMKTMKGEFIFFPSDMMHMVLPNLTEKDRICISMNIVVAV